MNQIMNEQDGGGILLIGNPGSGKTALVCHLLCSRTSSPFIHERILGYHFCMHSDKGTQNAAKFVRNLANMIALRIEEYLEAISSDSFVSKVLQDNCGGEPEWCLQEAIITPLKKLHHQPKKPWYVIIDALDECAADKAEILNMLKSKVRRFPVWLKMIITTRNMSTITKSFEGLQRLKLQQDDERNIDDIDRYATDRIYPLQGSIISKIKAYFSIKDNNALSQRIVSSLVEKSQGNFLYVRVVLDALSATTDSTRWTENIPRTLDNVFQLYFERKYTTRNSFQSLREIFEVLVASYRPLSAHQIHSVLQLDNPTLDYEYDIMPKLEEVSLFLWHGSRNGLVRIYHASLAEWLTGETNKGKLYYVKKENGHKRLAKYYLQNVKQIKKQLTPEEAFYLTRHVVEGGLNEHQVREFLSIPSHLINSTDKSGSTALHISARLAHPDVTELLVEHFLQVDCLNNEHRTSAFVSASAGCLENLIILASKGASLNHTVKCTAFKPSKRSKNLVRECRRMACEYSLLHIAAQEGNVNIVEFLIERNANAVETTGCNNTAIQLAAKNGHLEVVEVLKKTGGVMDGVSLHHAAAEGHQSVVDYLLNEGVKDTCIDGSYLLQDKTQNENRNNMLDTGHLKTLETALHAAVRKEHLSVIKALLSRQENALSCANAAGRLPLHEAVHFNNYNALQVLLTAGVNTSVRCNAGALAGLHKIYCPCGFTALHIAAAYGHYSVAKLLIEHNADVNVPDCDGSTPLHIASCHGKMSLIKLLVQSGANINQRTTNFSTPLHSAAACLATSSFCTLLELGSNYSAQDNKNMTVLHYLFNNIKVIGREYFVDLYVDRPINWIEALTEKEPWEKGDLQYTWLNALIRITHSLSANVKERLLSSLPEGYLLRKAYTEVLYLLEQKSNASFLLTGSGSYGETYLITMATPQVFLHDLIFHNAMKSVGIPFLPKLLTKTFLKTLSMLFPRALNCSLLTFSIQRNAVRFANWYLKAGVDVNCLDHSGVNPLLTYLRRGGRHMSKVLARYKVRMDISCGVPFKNSTLHLASYHKLHYLHYLYEYLRGEDEWSKFIASIDSLFDYFLDEYKEVQEFRGSSKVVRTGDGQLALAIKSHTFGTKVILDGCFDTGGYNALHRAAQGANVIAIERFLAWGANPSLKNAAGFSPLWLSVLYSVKYTPFLSFSNENIVTGLELDLASTSASLILDRLIEFETVNIGCNENSPDLTLYHLAAIRGMWRFVLHLLSQKELTGVDVNCPNRDGITPMYLAKLVGGDSCGWGSPWCKVVETIERFGGKLRFPNLEAEYVLFFYLFYGVSPGNVSLELPEHDVSTLQYDCEREECLKYHNGHTNLDESSTQLDWAYRDYRKQVDGCELNVNSGRCLPEIDRDLSHFQSVMPAVSNYQSLKFEHISASTSFSFLLDIERNGILSILSKVAGPGSRRQRPNDENTRRSSTFSSSKDENQQRTTNTFNENSQTTREREKATKCCEEEESDCTFHRHGSLRTHFEQFQDSADRLMKRSKQTRSVMFARGNFPRVLSRVDHALYNYHIASYCDWQANTAKYIILKFQIWNLNFFAKNNFVKENSRLVSISDFASSRIRKVLTGSSEDLLKLVLRLVSKEKFDDFNYLTILKFKKPPLWKGTYDAWVF